jgi:hypothetical protein
MHRFLIAGLLLCGVCAAEPQVRISLQFIEVSHPVLTELLAGEDQSGNALHAKAVSLSKEGKARILETCVLTGHGRQKLTLESIREEIYPTEYTPPALPCNIPAEPLPKPPMPFLREFRTPTAFETRNTGVTIEVEPRISQDGRTIQLSLSSAAVIPVRLDMFGEYRDRWGDASIRMPVYEKWGTQTTLSVTSGKFGLVSVIHPQPVAASPALSRRILVFIRADILPVSEN